MAGPNFKRLRKASESESRPGGGSAARSGSVARSGSAARTLFQSPEGIRDRNRATPNINASRPATQQELYSNHLRNLDMRAPETNTDTNLDMNGHETNHGDTVDHNSATNSDAEDDELESSDGKAVRGVGRCLALDKHVERFGKIKLKFNMGKREPNKYSVWFADAIGYTIRTSAEFENVSVWKKVPETNKEVCRTRLQTWFDIEDWESERIKKIINFKLQTSYRQWRNTLKVCYDKFKEMQLDPRKKSPRVEVTLEKWISVCDWLESETFQIKSNKNKRNREKMTSIHTSGRISYQTHYERMPENEQGRIELFRTTHVDKHGKFVDPKDEADYNKMVELKDASLLDGAEPKSDDQILVEVLGFRSGYQKGMGYGVVVARGSKYLSGAGEDSGLTQKLNETQAALDDTQSKLEETQTALENAEGKISSLSKKLEEEKEKNDNKFETLQRQIELMQQNFIRQ